MFVTFEGPEGGGKSSQIGALADFLRAQGRLVYVTREPGGTPIGDQIRQVIMDHGNSAMERRAEILLFLASRAQHVEEVIRPRLAAGEVVLCDRFTDSTLAYQGYGYDADVDSLRALNAFATGDLQPDLTVLLDLDVEVGINRRKVGEGEWNRLDAYALAFHRRVRQGYLDLARAEPARWVTVNAGRPPQVVQEAIRKVVLGRLVA